MRLVYISLYPPLGGKHAMTGGVASYTKNLITSLPLKSSDEVFMLCDKINGKYEEYEEDGISVIRCFDKGVLFARPLLSMIKKIKPDVVHVQQELSLYGNPATAYVLQWLLFLLSGYQTVLTLHGVVSFKDIDENFIKENNSQLPVWAVKLAFMTIYPPLTKWAKRIIVHEEYFKDILVNEYRVSRDKVDVIHHGVENFMALDRREARHLLGLPADNQIILFMGYQTGYKGLDLLIEGFAKYAESNARAFLIIGAGKHPKLLDDPKYLRDYERLQKKACQLIGNRHKWVGFIAEADMQKYYSASDASIYPYTVAMSSSGPMAFAIGYEKPFLASNVFANIFKQHQAILFDRSPTGLSEKINQFITNERKFADISRLLKQSRLWTTVAGQSYDIYHRLDDRKAK